MLIGKKPDIASSEITPKSLWLDRRRFITGAAALGIGVALPREAANAGTLKFTKSPLSTKGEELTSLKDVTGYNNFYEFGTDKSDPAAYAGAMKTRPWTVEISGEVRKPVTLDIEDILKIAPIEERIYRHRCVEAWSMVVPWNGFSLSALINRVEPTSKAKFVEFTSLADSKTMPGLLLPYLDWPYREGLRMDEAMHPLTTLVVGLYGETLKNQNGAPLRLVVPWKYGFKGAKSIVRIRFLERQPATAWNTANPSEFGFYSNVNPEVDHPRWTQAKERRIGDFFRRPTLMFNGYGEQVASLYRGMDLKTFF
ncbi:protein-methionine-sulfoxide reductase catalytic subunit MsrP [Parvibaculum sedimenti]|uniref:Protein-methionine-sulfoxide reductase catalytic subunit MsrP n=1 Tax=Parvibaculum sedimenti TaxID=2608632 RepID=A0A6N6VK52_9HYPH|nr:protein-methionine-sulfoxide reductase catalytic subunit MsrP [Parvibaculum sedimenti]KAB7739677.1 protein-methionine-sulfoxide reductase catalytic subunit MsrP [Parvibaculum sedimenti]